MNLTRTTDPAAEILTSALVEEKMAFSSGFDSNIVANLITEATTRLEDDTRLSFINQVWTMTLDHWPKNYNEIIYIPRGPVSSIDSFTYTDGSGNSQTLTEDTHFRVSTVGNCTRLTAIGDWPVDVADVDDYADAITIVYTAGFGASASDIPAWVKGALYLLIASDYSNGCLDTSESYNKKIAKKKDLKDYWTLNR